MPYILMPSFLQSGLDSNDLGKTASSVQFGYVSNMKISIPEVIVSSQNDVIFEKVENVVVWEDKLFFVVETKERRNRDRV